MLVFACVTDSDNQGKVPNGSIIDRHNQASLSLIITDNQVFFTTSLVRKNRDLSMSKNDDERIGF
jgi:hypothetical protein